MKSTVEIQLLNQQNFVLSFQIDFDIEATFTITSRGHVKLTKGCSEYVKYSNRNDITSWRCDQYKQKQCKAKARTRQIGAKHLAKFYGYHSHEIVTE